MGIGKTFAWTWWRGRVSVALSLAGPDDINDADWAGYLATCEEMLSAHGGDASAIRALSFSDGGAPNAAQRERMHALLQRAPVRAAIVTTSRVARGAITALGWFNPNVRAFAPDQLDRAFDHLRIDTGERGALLSEIGRTAATFRPLAATSGVPGLGRR